MLGRSANPGPHQRAARQRSLIAFASFALGIALSLQLPAVDPVVWFGLACIGVGVAPVLRGRGSPAALALALGLLGAGVGAGHLGPWPEGSLARSLPGHDAQPLLIEVEGLILSRPERYTPPSGALSAFIPVHMNVGERTRFDLDTRRVRVGDAWRHASGVLTVWVETEGAGPDIRAGQSVRLTGTASASAPPANPGQPDWSLQNRDTNRVGSISTSPELIEPVPSATAWDRVQSEALALRTGVQSRASSIIERATRDDPYAGPLIRGLILGVTGRDDTDVTGAFRRVGLLHLLAVSGFHVTVAAGLVLLALRLTGDRGWLEPLLVCLALGLYVMIVPMRSPIFRAALMVLAMLAGDAFGRRHDRIAVISWVAIIWLAIRPSDLFTLGFQLSFGLTWWLMMLSEPRRNDVPIVGEPTRLEMLRFAVLRTIRTHVSTWSLAVPAIVYHTGLISPLAVLASVVTVPLIIVSMWLGFLVLVLGALVPGLEPLTSALLRSTAGASARAAIWFDDVPLATLHLTGASLPWTLCATGSVIWLWRRARLRDWRWVAIVLGLGAWLAVEGAVARRSTGEAGAVHMLAVGDGSALLLTSGGEAALWDAGSWRADVGRVLIPEACRAIGAPRVPTVFITHANIDHYMGLLDAAELLGVRTVVTGESFARAAQGDPGSAPAFVLAELARMGIEHRVAVAGDTFEIGDGTLCILHPPEGFEPRAENDASLVAMFEPPDGAARVLLTGDIQQEAIAMLMESGRGLGAQVIELPHHGSAIEPAFEFVRTIDPKVVLQSTGRRRLDDPRWDSVRAGRTWLVTQRHGTSSVLLMPDGSIRARAFR